MREEAIFYILPLPGYAFCYPLYTTCVPLCIAFFINNFSLLTYQKEKMKKRERTSHFTRNIYNFEKATISTLPNLLEWNIIQLRKHYD